MSDLESFMQNWQDESGCKELLQSILKLAVNEKLNVEYLARPGVSHSFRLGVPGGTRPFFAMADVIDDDPEARWLSVCMYADVSDDPDGRGDIVPKGLNDQDATCFDVDAPDDDEKNYILQVLRKAAQDSH